MAEGSYKLVASAVASAGRLVAAYSRAVASPAFTEIVLEAPCPQAPAVWIGWHEANLIALALHPRVSDRAAMAFVPPGLHGAAMRGWLEALDVTPVPLAPDARRGLALRQMEAALACGKDVLIAVDGPRGPRHRVAPGALWLARAMGVEIRPVGSAASPALRLPRWDRLIVPLPGARIALVVGAALPKQISPQSKTGLAATLHGLSERALAAVARERTLKPREALPWR